ncbi:diguanylate cyclase [uncultured Thiodictyon sp.]|uniref:diguanylate cyclase domain-containing protein n=1 Tax=uncultured Thiodictyon sp. TaxID=1846217 RepID=UPI0025D6F59B|nr:diguanylate cyclase [uncultured Thiodictyon sp.]
MITTVRILIVDDDPAAIEALEHALAGLGELCCATGGAQALALMADDPVDLVLLDANMPDLDGFATCHSIKQEYPDIPVIFVTAFGDEVHEVRALKAGAVDFVHKPIKPPVVRARVGVHLRLNALNAELRALSGRDALTGIANRRALDNQLVLEWRRAARQRQPLGLLMIDIDHFKRYNDYYGHVRGDDCLRQVAQVLAAMANRAGDLVARYGGEEFAVLLAGSNLEGAGTLAGKICAAVRALAIPHVHSAVAPYVTVSIGVASGVPAIDPTRQGANATSQSAANAAPVLQRVQVLLARADRALYAAKAAGRDRVCVEAPATAVES